MDVIEKKRSGAEHYDHEKIKKDFRLDQSLKGEDNFMKELSFKELFEMVKDGGSPIFWVTLFAWIFRKKIFDSAFYYRVFEKIKNSAIKWQQENHDQGVFKESLPCRLLKRVFGSDWIFISTFYLFCTLFFFYIIILLILPFYVDFNTLSIAKKIAYYAFAFILPIAFSYYLIEAEKGRLRQKKLKHS